MPTFTRQARSHAARAAVPAAILLAAGLCAAQPAVTPSEPSTAPAAPVAPAAAAPTAAPDAAAGQPAVASTPESAPAASDAKPNTIFIRVMEGKVILRKVPGNTAIVAKVGDTIDENTEIMTSQSGLVQIQVGSGQRFTIERLSRVLVKTAIKEAGVEKTNLEVPQGRIKFDIERVASENKVEIKAPDATLAVKGTTGLFDVTPGQATYAAGGDLNTGLFNVLYNNAASASVKGKQQTTATRISTVKTELGNLFVDAADHHSRSGDEQKFAEEHVSRPSVTPGNVIEGTSKLQDFAKGVNYWEIASRGNILASIDLFGVPFKQTAGFSGLGSDRVAGTSVTEGGVTQIFTVENSYGGTTGKAPLPIIRTLSVVNGNHVYQTVTSFAETGTFGRTSWELTGLAKLDGQFYAAGTTYTDFATINQQVERGQIYRVPVNTPSTHGLAPQNPVPVMNLGLDLQRGLASSASDGSLFVVGSLPTTSFGFTAGATAVILQIDPRNNYIQNAWSNVTGQFSAPAGSALAGLTTVSGITFLSGTMIITGTTSSGTNIRVAINPFAGTGPSPTAQVLSTQSLGGRRIALASDTGGPAAAPATLSPTAPSLPARDDINLLFSNMGYSTAARNSGVIDLIIRQQILSTAINQGGAVNSGILNIIPGIVGMYDNRQAGVGLTVAEFRRRVQELTGPARGALPPSLFYNTPTGGGGGI